MGRIGYISKGPVLTPDNGELESFALAVLLGLVRSHRLAVLIAQPPDHNPLLADALQRHGFGPNRVVSVIDATMWVDLSGPPGAWEANQDRRRRRELRNPMRQGVTIYEGGDGDIPVFFDLMLSTCQRHGVKPTPPTLAAATQLVQAFRKSGESRLALAICQGETVAAVLDLRFGNRYTAWKKGWNGRHGKQNPNVLLTYDSLRKAHELGCTCFDFAGVGRSFAETLLAQQPLTQAQQTHYDCNKLGFGGHPQLLPPAMIYCRNPLVRLAYRQMASRPMLAGWLKRLAGKV